MTCISDKQLILEEVSYLLALGFREDDKDLILLGMNVARNTYDDDHWDEIGCETLRWHCENFFRLGNVTYARTKTTNRRYDPRNKGSSDADL